MLILCRDLVTTTKNEEHISTRGDFFIMTEMNVKKISIKFPAIFFIIIQ